MKDLAEAYTAIQAQKLAIANSIEQGLIDRQRGGDVLRGLDIALLTIQPEQVMLESRPIPRMDLERVPGGFKIKQITYCREMNVLEAQMADGSIRTHKGVDSNAWFCVKRESDGESGYYNFIWNKFPYDEQRP